MHPNKRWLGDPEYEEPHLRGEILVAAVTQTLLRIWFNRLRILASANRRTSGPQRTEPPSHALVAEEGAKAAEHLLRMVIRAIDYMPPVDLEYEDVIDAIIEADTIMTPVDDHHYRQSLTNAFASFGIEKPEKTTVNISKTPLVYDNVNFTLLSSDPDEAFRFIWSNAPLLGIDRRFDICVDQVVPCVRTGPDGLMVHETIVTYVQSVEGTALELGKLLPARFDVSVELPRRAKFQMWGGGTLVFDQFGQVRHHQSKPLFDWDRQNRRLDYLLRTEAEDAEGRLAFAPHALSSRRRFPFHRPFAGGRRSEW